jgi:soluble lytic murein transglycosylase-like protein
MAPLAHPLRGLWNGLERARKSLGVCSFGFFAFSLVSIVGQGAPAPEMVYRVDPAAAAAAAALDSSSAPLPAATPPAAPPPPVMPSPKLGFDRALGVPRTPFGKQIYKVALRYALNPHLVAAVVQAESDFNPRARSRKGACGLMQVLPSTARRFGLHRRRDLFNPTKNLDTGARYLRWLVDRFGDDAMRVLAAYNSGEGNVERFGGLPPFPETRGYVQHIFARLGFTLLLPALTTPAPAALPAVDSALLAGSR